MRRALAAAVASAGEGISVARAGIAGRRSAGAGAVDPHAWVEAEPAVDPRAWVEAEPAVDPRAWVEAERAALRTIWSSFWRSRLMSWAGGCLAVGVLGTVTENVSRFDATGISTSFGRVGDVLAASAVRGDAIWYLRIAHGGYSTTPATRFFPLYPLLVRAGSWLTGSPVIAGVLISLLALLGALLTIHRLVVLELGAQAANATVELIAFGPLALFLSAVYSESLYLALSAGTFYAARRGRWATAGALGGLAALTRVTGVLLVVPVVLLFLYGPRGDADPDYGPRGDADPHSGPRGDADRDYGPRGDADPHSGPRGDAEPARRLRRLMPRYRVTPALLWAGLIPAGTAAFSGYLMVRGYGPLAYLHAQSRFLHHHAALPFVSVWDDAPVAWQQLKLGFQGIVGFVSATQGVVGMVALAAALVALCGVFRRLPFAYGAFVVVALLVPLSSPTIGDPLKGLARYETVMFPLFMWAGAWAVERGTRRLLLIGCGALMLFFTAQFATWHIVGSQLL